MIEVDNTAALPADYVAPVITSRAAIPLEMVPGKVAPRRADTGPAAPPTQHAGYVVVVYHATGRAVHYRAATMAHVFSVLTREIGAGKTARVVKYQ